MSGGVENALSTVFVFTSFYPQKEKLSEVNIDFGNMFSKCSESLLSKHGGGMTSMLDLCCTQCVISKQCMKRRIMVEERRKPI